MGNDPEVSGLGDRVNDGVINQVIEDKEEAGSASRG